MKNEDPSILEKMKMDKDIESMLTFIKMCFLTAVGIMVICCVYLIGKFAIFLMFMYD